MSSSLTLCTDCDMWWKVDFMWQPVAASSVAGPRSYKALPKAKSAPKKGHSHCLVVCCLSDPKPLYLRSMLSKSMICTENCDTCSRHWSTESARFCSKTTPNHMSHNQRFKSSTNWATKFCLIRHIHLTSFNWLPLLQASQQLLAGKMLPQPAAGRKCFPSLLNSKSQIFTL